MDALAIVDTLSVVIAANSANERVRHRQSLGVPYDQPLAVMGFVTGAVGLARPAGDPSPVTRAGARRETSKRGVGTG